MNNNRKLYFSVVSFVLVLTAMLVGIFSLTESQLNVNGYLGFTSHAELAVSSSMCEKIANGFGFTWRSRRELVVNSIGGPCCKELSEIETLKFVNSVNDTMLKNFEKDNDGKPKGVSVISDDDAALGNITAYYSSTEKTLIVYSPKTIYAPADSTGLFMPFYYYEGESSYNAVSNLKNIDFSNFDTSKVTNAMGMFNDLKSLQTLDLTQLDLSNVTNMSYMFAACTSLTEVRMNPINKFSKVTNINLMFNDCSSLINIYMSGECDFNKDTVTGENVFNNCEKLEGASMSFDSNCVDKTYASTINGYFIEF